MRTFFTFLLLALVVTLSVSAPVPASAYMTPEEVLEEDDFVTPPPNSRGAKAARAAQEAEYDERAADETTAAEAATDDEEDILGSNTLDDLHGAAENEEEEVVDWQDEEAALSAQERHNERVLERVERSRLDDMADNGVILRGSAPDEPLHGGAPLAPTGMGTVVIILAIAAATGYTLRKVLRS